MSQQEFVDLINKHKGVIHKACRTYCKSFSHADLVQETILEAWKSISNFEKNCTFSTWLYYIARNVCVTHLRKRSKQPTIEGLEEYAEVLAETNNAPEMVKQLRQAIRYDSVLDNIEEPWRSTFEMYIEGFSFNEMEMQTGVDQNTLRVNMFRIKKRLFLRYGKSEKFKL